MTQTAPDQTYVLSFDIGGTYIKFGIIDPTGELVYDDKLATPEPGKQQGEAITEQLTRITEKMKNHFSVTAIGISAHGIVDHIQQQVIYCSNYLPGMRHLPLSAILQRQFDLPVIMENDGKAAALGEYWQGSGEKYNSFIFVALGTSIGGGIILNGQLWRGIDNIAGEIGYIITHETDKTERFIPGAWEAYASAGSLIRRFRDFKSDQSLTEHAFNEALMQHDPQAQEALRQYAHSLSSGLLALAHSLAPEAFILGGAITRMGATLLDPVKEEFRQRALEPISHIPILAATLGNRAGMIGVALLARQQISRH